MRMGFSQRAHSLIETMMVLVILSAVVSQGVPAMNQMVATVRLRASMTAMMTALRLARYEAIRRNARVVVCKSANGTACTSDGGWEQGWLVFFDDNNNLLIDADELVLYVEKAMPANIRISGNEPVRTYLSYTANGRAKLVSGAFLAGTLTICQPSAVPTQAYLVIINAIGNPRAEKKTVPQC